MVQEKHVEPIILKRSFFLGLKWWDTSILSQERVTFNESQALCMLYVGGAR